MGLIGTAGIATQPVRTLRWLTLLGGAVAIGMLALGAMVLLDSRDDAWQQAERSADNLALALERDITRNVAVYDLSVQGAIEAFREPGMDAVSPTIRRAAIFDRAATAEYLGSILILDAAGNVVLDSTSSVPHPLNLSDRDYFKVHQASADAGLFVSRPYHSRLRGGAASIAISRRIDGPGGRFDGVAIGALELSYFRALFDRLALGANGSVSLIRTDGHVVARSPHSATDFDRDISGSPGFDAIRTGLSGRYVTKGAVDGVSRLYTFRRIGDLPLVVTVGLSVSDIYTVWWRKAAMVGGMLALLCAATVALCVLFRLEVARRLAAEAALVGRAETLAVMAATDGLTGLGNRRAFEAEMFRAWRHAIRNEEPVSLLMIDADHFKLYNDRYGHQAGDRVLRSIAACIQQTIRRPRDLGARYGGEEFVVLLPETTVGGAADVAERIRTAAAALAIPHAGNPAQCVTISVGVATARPCVHHNEGSLLKQADQALYDAKHQGRNQVSIAPHPAGVPVDWGAVLQVDAA